MVTASEGLILGGRGRKQGYHPPNLRPYRIPGAMLRAIALEFMVEIDRALCDHPEFRLAATV